MANERPSMSLPAHAHECLHLIVEGMKVAPETKEAVRKALEDFSDACIPILCEQFREDLLQTPPDDRDAQWHEYMKTAEKENL